MIGMKSSHQPRKPSDMLRTRHALPDGPVHPAEDPRDGVAALDDERRSQHRLGRHPDAPTLDRPAGDRRRRVRAVLAAVVRLPAPA